MASVSDDLEKHDDPAKADAKHFEAVEGEDAYGNADQRLDKRIDRKFDLHIVPWLFGIW